jgi:hypothetical protein
MVLIVALLDFHHTRLWSDVLRVHQENVAARHSNERTPSSTRLLTDLNTV